VSQGRFQIIGNSVSAELNFAIPVRKICAYKMNEKDLYMLLHLLRSKSI